MKNGKIFLVAVLAILCSAAQVVAGEGLCLQLDGVSAGKRPGDVYPGNRD